MVGYLVTISYNLLKENPFTTFGEAVFLFIQNVLVTLLVFYYSSSALLVVLSIAALGAYGYALLFLAPFEFVLSLQVLIIPVFTLSRLLQAFSNYKAGSTGDLSAITVFGFALGNLARVFTTMKEVDDPIVLAGFIVNTAVNVFLALQVVYYRGKAPKAAAAVEVAADAKADASATGTSAQPSASGKATQRPSKKAL